jgi:hypothetical protein
MSSPASSSQEHGPAIRRASWPDSRLRVGDAERMAIADRLAGHFSEGRLTEAEFSERLDRAMQATTMADLTGLLSDLPDAEPDQAEPQRGPAASRRHQRKILHMQLERERLRLAHERRQHRRAAQRDRARGAGWLLVLAGALILLIVVVHALSHSIGAWLILGLIAFIWLRRDNTRYRGN